MNFNTKIIFNFSNDSNIRAWKIVDDVVMGGQSQGKFIINNSGNGLFYGEVSLKNNGGFSSVRYIDMNAKVFNYSKIVFRVKGDGKKYQFRIKDDVRNYYAYMQSFETTNDWQTIELNLSEMYPIYRGRELNMSNFSSSKIEEIAFLIGNQRNESFKLEIDKIYLE